MSNKIKNGLMLNDGLIRIPLPLGETNAYEWIIFHLYSVRQSRIA